jgi:anthranilate phosphoribosyltransferase
MTDDAPFPLTEALATVVRRGDLTELEMRRVMTAMVAGRCADADVAALLTALRMKGETAVELAAAAAVLRENMVRLDAGRSDVLDTCGTGGDGSGTFNVSTAAALVVAGAGVPVVKHGNRAASSHSGSADVLAALGVTIECSPATARRCLDEAGLAFCFAPHFHPCLRHVAGVRRQLRLRTLFNGLGPLANPASAPYQLLGVGRSDWLDPLAGALARLGMRRAYVVCGRDGLDEVSLCGPTLVREVRGSTVLAREWTPEDFGLESCSPAELTVTGVEHSARVIREVLDGRDGPAARMVLANAAAGLVAAERVGTPAEGVARARAALAEGRARQVLDRLIRASREAAV